MTEFTKDKMEDWRHIVKTIRSQPVESGRVYLLTGVLANALDEIERLQAENADIKHLCVFALHGLGKLSFEQWHLGDWVHDEIWRKYRKIAHEVFEEYGKKYKALQARVEWLEHFLEEAAHAAACGKNPADYLATEVPTSLRDEIGRLQKRIAELEQERRWISVDEKRPENWEKVIVVDSQNGTLFSRFNGIKFLTIAEDKTIDNVIFWQPIRLPQHPQEEE